MAEERGSAASSPQTAEDQAEVASSMETREENRSAAAPPSSLPKALAPSRVLKAWAAFGAADTLAAQIEHQMFLHAHQRVSGEEQADAEDPEHRGSDESRRELATVAARVRGRDRGVERFRSQDQGHHERDRQEATQVQERLRGSRVA